jgi:hypothetical protein
MHSQTSPAILPAMSTSESKPWTRHIPTVARILMGLPLFVGGLNGLLNFLPQPQVVLPERALAFVSALMASGYMMQLIAITQLIVGALLLANRFVPLALVLFAPFIVNAVAFHVFLEPSGLIPALVFLAVELYLAWIHRAAFHGVLAARPARA